MSDTILTMSAGPFVIEQTIGSKFEPMPDITAYELAKLLPYFHGKQMYQEDWERLGLTVTRHLQRTPKP